MPRLDKSLNGEFERQLIANPDKPDSYFARTYGLSVQAVNKRRRKLKPKLESILEYDGKVELQKVEGSLNDKLEGDIEKLRRIAFDELSKAMTQNDRKAVLDWFDRVTGNAKLRSDISRSLSLLVDNRTQTNILQITETAAPTMIRLLKDMEGKIFSFDTFLNMLEKAVK